MPTLTPPSQTRPSRFGGLDGLRAIAVGLVLIYHLFPGVLPGGFLGVDVFFVISGFLITSLLLREFQAHGKLRLFDFWRRRARRLLPALALVLLVSTSLALVTGGDLLVKIGSQIAGAAFFVSNWVFIANGADYFARDTPELFRNTWSLSIEEQFYIVLPLLVLVLFRFRHTATRMIPLLMLAVLSASWMFELSLLEVDPTRIYFGSDSHTFGLFLGAAMAIYLHGRAQAKTVTTPRVPLQLWYFVVALAGLTVLIWLAVTTVEGSQASFQGGFQLATVASLIVVWAITRNQAWAGRALDAPPFRWVGERSYGIYLWHWPIVLLLTDGDWRWIDAAAKPWLIGSAALIITVLVSALSYRYVEQPVRRFGLITSLRLLVKPSAHGPRRRTVAIALAIVLIATVPATAYAVATAPRMTSAAEAITRGQDMLEKQSKTSETPSATTPPPESTGKHHTETQPPIAPEGQDISAVGDSVMLASLPELTAALPDIYVDAAVSRGFGAGVGVTNDLAAEGALRSVVVVGLGTNGPVETADIDAIRTAAGTRPLVLVNAHADRDWIPEVNQTLADYAAAHTGVVVADWSEEVNGVEGALAGDGIHPNTSGGEIYAASVQKALKDLQEPGEAVGFHLARR